MMALPESGGEGGLQPPGSYAYGGCTVMAIMMPFIFSIALIYVSFYLLTAQVSSS